MLQWREPQRGVGDGDPGEDHHQVPGGCPGLMDGIPYITDVWCTLW